MCQTIPINQVTSEFGITSRTIRYWEQMGLFKSSRDPQSNWRIYDEKNIKRIRLVITLRELDIPIKGVKKILESKELNVIKKIFQNKIERLKHENIKSVKMINMLKSCLAEIKSLQNIQNECNWMDTIEQTLAIQISSKEKLKNEWEEMVMTNNPLLSGALRIISLPAMRVAVSNVISESPEEKALSDVLEWAKGKKLMGTARIFGFNTTRYTPESTEYGWAACISIPEQVILPDYLEEKNLPGGLYAAYNSTNEVYDSWQTLMRILKESHEYEVDKNRPCLEEHIPSGEGKGTIGNFYLTLLEPVKEIS